MTKSTLERDIQDWKKSLYKHVGFEPEDIEELDDHFRSKIDDLIDQGLSEKAAFDQARDEFSSEYNVLVNEYQTSRSRLGIGGGLLSTFVKVALRNLRRHWSYAIVNLLGLTVAIGSVITISTYVISELNYDSFHLNKKHIARVVNEYERESGTLRYPLAPPALGPALVGKFPEVKRVTRMRTIDRMVLAQGSREFLESKGFYADSSFLQMFSFDLKSAASNRVLSEPNSIVLTESLAQKLFPDQQCIGQVVQMDNEKSLVVTGVLYDIPENSHIQFDFLISFQTYEVPEGYLADLHSWGWMGFLTYVQMQPESEMKMVESLIEELYKTNNSSKSNTDIHINLQPLSQIYLGSEAIANPHGALFESNSKSNLYSLMGIALLIMIIAGFNYVNVNIATIQTRLKELGMRRVLGSSQSKLFLQILSEAIINVWIASLLGLLISYVIFRFDMLPFSHHWIMSFSYLMGLCIFLIGVGVVLGSVIALASRTVIATASTLSLLKSQVNSGRTSGFLKNTILFAQYLIAAGLIATTLIVMRQIGFMNNKDLGYHPGGIISISGTPESIAESYPLFEKRALQESVIEAVTPCSHAFAGSASGGPMHRDIHTPEQSIHTAYYQVGHDFLKTTGITLVQGRFFSKDTPSDSTVSIVLNQQAASAMGITELDGQKVVFNNGRVFRVIGIVNDFHFRSLHHKIGPMALVMPFTVLDNVLVRFREGHLTETYAMIDRRWNQSSMNQSSPVNIKFLDESLATQYKREADLETVIRAFSVLAILLSCVGLLGLTAATINQKLRQICVRKILGAGAVSIIVSVCRSSLLSAIGATVLAWPISILISGIWLDDYAYHYEPDISVLLITSVFVISITLLTLSIQYYKVNYTNPAQILRND
ncbi:MAG: ABC transporter permease [Cyclobacteriaceae bacterium]